MSTTNCPSDRRMFSQFIFLSLLDGGLLLSDNLDFNISIIPNYCHSKTNVSVPQIEKYGQCGRGATGRGYLLIDKSLHVQSGYPAPPSVQIWSLPAPTNQDGDNCNTKLKVQNSVPQTNEWCHGGSAHCSVFRWRFFSQDNEPICVCATWIMNGWCVCTCAAHWSHLVNNWSMTKWKHTLRQFIDQQWKSGADGQQDGGQRSLRASLQ